MTKNIRNCSLTIFVFIAFLFSACDKGFEDINKSVDFVSTPNLDYELPYVQLTMLDKNYYTHAYYAGAYSSQLNTNKDFPSITAYKDAEMSEHFVWIYKNPLKTVLDLIDHAKSDPAKVNYLSMGRILKAYLFHHLTDSYGDIPYFQAGKGYTDQIMTPEYDSQQAIYQDMFKELNEAATAFDSKKDIPTASDIVYKGNLEKWKRFAYSLMLRLGLRIMEVDPINGKKWIETAIAGGVMNSNEDSFVVSYTSQRAGTGTTSNGVPHIFISSSYIATYRLAAPFVDSLKNHNDPRTLVYCMRLTAPFSSYHDGDHTFANQQGYPQFSSIAESRNNFSVSNIKTFGRYDAPYVHLSYAQVKFQLAECMLRGIVTGNPVAVKSNYEEGVRAAMSQLAIYGNNGVITTEQQNEYLRNNPFNPARGLEMINTQYWIETHYNWYESWANMRRSGYPDTYSKLDLSLSGNLGAELPRRLFYPRAEYTANPGIQKAIERQGPDLTSTRIWWNKK